MGIFGNYFGGGNKFPYTNFHDLNMDWIIGVVREFQTQYTHIQETIENGETELTELTVRKLAELNALASTLTTQLQTDLNTALVTFTTSANQTAQEVLQTIPEDYTAMGTSVTNLKMVAQQLGSVLQGESVTPPFNIGYSINADGEYFRAWGNEDKRASTEMYSESLDGFKVVVNSSDITFNVYFYSEMAETAFISSAGGPFTGEHIFSHPYSKYFRIVLMSENTLPNNVQSLVTVTNYSNLDVITDMLTSPKNAYYPIEFTTQFGAITINLTPNEVVGLHAVIPVKAGEKYLIDGYMYNTTYPLYFFRDNYGVISYYTGTEGKLRNVEVTVPDNALFMYVNARHNTPYDMRIFKKIDTVADMAKDLFINKNRFIGKSIVWYGTSIPANGYLGSDHPEAYPQQVGKLLGANVINKAVGSSCIYCKDPTRINSDNPYGFLPNFESASRCLTNSIAEMTWICDHYNSSIWTSGTVSSMPSELREQILACSYENMLLPYLTAQTEPFMFVFDHGFNDSPDTHNYYETYGDRNLYTFRGGMNFLIAKIFAFNPYANVVIIGNYDNRETIQQMQEEVAKDWSIPIIKQWEYLKFSRTENVTVYGQWVEQSGSYRWTEDSTARTMTLKDRLIPDHIHPWSDPTGNNVKMITEGLYREMLTLTLQD